MSPELPPELWLEIIHSAPRETLLTLHRVSPAVSSLSRTVLFAEFIFSPIYSDEHEFHRLTFWSSKRIAPNVRSCSINLSVLGEPITTDTSRTIPLVSATFAAVSHFTNLQKLICGAPRMLPLEIPALQLETLKSLKSLHIASGSIVPCTTVKLPLEEFTHSDMPFPESHPRCDFFTSPPIAFIDPSTLRSLIFQSSSIVPIWLGGWVSQPAPDTVDTDIIKSYTNLHSVEISCTHFSQSEFISFIATFPALHDLTVVNFRRFAPSTPGAAAPPPTKTTPIPHLTKYRGPAQLLPFLLVVHSDPAGETAVPRPHTLDITRGGLADLWRALQHCQAAVLEGVVCLRSQAELSELARGGESSLRDTLAFVPNLQDLDVVVHSNGTRYPVGRNIGITDQDLCNRVASALSNNKMLQKVKFTWRSASDDPSWQGPTQAMLDEGVKREVPGLTVLESKITFTV
ncbi:F-box domain-containing protein, partial [Favolaschia claudopus]